MFPQISFAILLLALGQYANGQVISFGDCPKTSTIEDFDVDSYAGLWYGYGGYPFVFAINTKCSYSRYGRVDANTISVQNVAIKKSNNETTEIEGFAKIVGPGSFAVYFFPGQSQTKPNYNVIGTNYTTYTVVYTCEKVLFGKIEYLWILTRDRIPSEETTAKALKVVKDNGISTKFLEFADQRDCPAVEA